MSAINRCESSYANAERACSSAGSSGGGGSSASGKSIAQLCAEWNATGTVAGDANTSAGSACTAAYRSCVSTCESLADQIGPSNAGAGNELIYIADDCYALGDRAMALGEQGLSSYNSAEMGRMCNERAKAQSVGEGSGPKGRGRPGSTSDGESLEKKFSDFAKGDAGFLDPTPSESPFNVDSLDDGLRAERPRVEVPSRPGGAAPVVPNNSGTQLPGGDKNAVNGRPSKPADKGSPGGNRADVLQGLQAGGSGFERPSRREREPSQVSRSFKSSKARDKSLELERQFRHSLNEALRRRMAGRFYSNSLGIHGSGVDIFARITERMREKCAMGTLTDCR